MQDVLGESLELVFSKATWSSFREIIFAVARDVDDRQTSKHKFQTCQDGVTRAMQAKQ